MRARIAPGNWHSSCGLAELAAAAKAVGMKAEGVQVSREALSEMRPPALAYVNGNHFAGEVVAFG